MPAPRGLNVINAAKYMGVSAGTFRKLVRLGIAPQPLKIPEVNRNIYDREAIDQAMTAMTVER
jgi:predicted DNA-binding transcriptional regulator AlpA